MGLCVNSCWILVLTPRHCRADSCHIRVRRQTWKRPSWQMRGVPVCHFHGASFGPIGYPEGFKPGDTFCTGSGTSSWGTVKIRLTERALSRQVDHWITVYTNLSPKQQLLATFSNIPAWIGQQKILAKRATKYTLFRVKTGEAFWSMSMFRTSQVHIKTRWS